MKKLFTLLTLLCAVTGAWAQDEEFVTLRTVDFTEMTPTTFVDGENTIQDAGYTDLRFWKKKNYNLTLNATAGEGINFNKQNIAKNHLVAIPLSNVNGSIRVTLYHGYDSNKASFKTAYTVGTEVSAGDNGTGYNTNQQTPKDAANADTQCSCTYTGITGSDIVLYVGEAGSSYTCIKKVVVETIAAGPSDPVDVTFSLSANEIGLDETAQIKVNAKAGLDGLTMNNLTYDNTVISIDETGKITPVAVGTSAITFTTAAVENKYNAGSANLSITVTAPVVATPVISPADGSKFYGESQVVTATCATEGAVLSYSIDNEATWTVLPEEGITITETTTIIVKAEKEGFVASKATATITKSELVLDERVDISASATWDWSKYGTNEIKTENTPFYRETVVVSNVEKYGFAAPAEAFGPAQALTLKGDYIVRDSKYCQVTEVTFKTTAPGKLSVVFSNTGSKRPYRYLSVNGVLTEFKSNVSNATTEATDIVVKAGEVVLNGVVDPDAKTNYEGYSGDDAGQVNFLRIYSIVFTADDTVGIQTVNNNAANNGEVYNLAGQRMDAPVKGLYIVNGKKVVIK